MELKLDGIRSIHIKEDENGTKKIWQFISGKQPCPWINSYQKLACVSKKGNSSLHALSRNKGPSRTAPSYVVALVTGVYWASEMRRVWTKMCYGDKIYTRFFRLCRGKKSKISNFI